MSRENPYPLIEEEYRQWLTHHDPEDSIGVCRMHTECVLAKFLQERHGEEFYIGTRSYDRNSEEDTRFFLPYWAQEEVEFFDELSDFQHIVTYAEYKEALQNRGAENAV